MFPLRQLVDQTFLRFIAVGFSNFAVSFSVFWLCLQVPLNLRYKASLSQLVAYAVATMWSFFWNRRLTFRSSGPVLKQATKFIILQISLALVSAVLIGYTVDRMEWPPIPSWLVIMSAVTIVNFLLSRWWVFT
jgi:putative flippase GtrA